MGVEHFAVFVLVSQLNIVRNVGVKPFIIKALFPILVFFEL